MKSQPASIGMIMASEYQRASWLLKSSLYWTISPLGDDTVAFVSSSGTFGVINSYRTNLGVAPSLYLSSDTRFHGMGSQQDSFTIIN